MKNKSIAIALLTMMVGLITSCQNYNMKITTTVNEDGSCSRNFDIEVDYEDSTKAWSEKTMTPEEMLDSAVMRFDKKWEMTWSKKNDSTQHTFAEKMAKRSQDTLLVHAKREFATIDEMNEAMPLRYNGKAYEVKGELKKSFKWFYTEYTYTETFHNVANTFKVPLKDYVEEDIAEYWFTGEPDIMDGLSGEDAKERLDAIDEKISRWATANLVYDMCDILLKHYDSIQNPPVSKTEFEKNRTELIRHASVNENIWESDDCLKVIFDDFYESDVYRNALDEGTEAHKEFTELWYDKYIGKGLVKADYILKMPGEVTEAPHGRIVNGMAVYKLSVDHFLQKDYTISATSRVHNVWAYIVAILVIVVAVGSYWFKK